MSPSPISWFLVYICFVSYDPLIPFLTFSSSLRTTRHSDACMLSFVFGVVVAEIVTRLIMLLRYSSFILCMSYLCHTSQSFDVAYILSNHMCSHITCISSLKSGPLVANISLLASGRSRILPLSLYHAIKRVLCCSAA